MRCWRSMEKTVYQLDSAALGKINVDEKKDRCHEKITSNRQYYLEFGVFDYNHARRLSHEDAKRAHDYIRLITKKYPFQLRRSIANPLWERFCIEWCNTGDINKSLGAI